MQSNEVKALITGGVSGLGLAVARKIVSNGGQVVLLDINDVAGAEAVGEMGEAASYIRTDVTSEQEVQEAVNTAVNRMGLINVAVNCAGIIGAGRIGAAFKRTAVVQTHGRGTVVPKQGAVL